MTYQNGVKYDKELHDNLRVDCEKCFGFCCVALYFSASEGFPIDKDAGKPCLNLQSDFKCAIHKNLRQKGLKGCTAYDCFGADLIGADLRDADIRGANLSNSIFITQAQINAAKGDANTRLPMSLVRPTYWDK